MRDLLKQKQKNRTCFISAYKNVTSHPRLKTNKRRNILNWTSFLKIEIKSASINVFLQTSVKYDIALLH
jgi:hypothetical protein